MKVHTLTDQHGKQFDLHIDDSARIVDVVGEWPSGEEEFRLEGPLPEHVEVEKPSARVKEEASKRGLRVCYQDAARCQTCFCDKNNDIMYCKPMC